MERVPFVLVEIQLRKLYGDFSLTDQIQIEERCELAREFVLACGWDIDDYIRILMGYDVEM